jgi:two-component system response regulator YesN
MIIIADDEKLSRITLISMLEELNFNSNDIREASNGEELVEMVKELIPSIVFVDIQMPKLNGLESIKQAKAYAPNTKWIILSGYSEFSYAQEAVQLGVSNYLLKPVSPIELEDVLKSTMGQYKDNLHDLNMNYTNLITKLFYRDSDKLKTELFNRYMSSYFIGYVVFINGNRSNFNTVFYKHMDLAVNEMIGMNNNMAIINLHNSRIAIVCKYSKTNEVHEIEDLIQEKIKMITREINDEASDVVFSIVGLIPDSTLEELIEQIRSIVKYDYLSILTSMYEIININYFKKLVNNKTIKVLGKYLIELIDCYSQSMYLNYNNIVDELEKLFKCNTIDYEIVCNSIGYLTKVIDFNKELLYNFHKNNRDYDKVLIKELRNIGEKMLTKKSIKGEKREIIDQIKHFIKHNYMLDIGVKEIANYLNITPNYLCSLFHEKTGTTLLKYLTKTRMSKAKEILSLEHAVKIQTVAEQVGYYSISHFNKVFKKYYGYSPAAYRDMKAEKRTLDNN